MLMQSKSVVNMDAEKRAKIRQQERHQLKMQMRADLPVLTKAEIRRCRLPYYEVMIEELEDNECYSSANYFKLLLKYQEELRRENINDIIVMSRPILKNCDEELLMLRNGLETAENFQNAGNVRQAVCTFLETAERFGLHTTNWLWLADELFLQALSVSNAYKYDGNFSKALSCYVYGKYLFEQNLDTDKCIDYLNLAREFSKGTQWTTYLLYKVYTKPLFVETCTLLHTIILRLAKEHVRIDPAEGLKYCIIAKQRAMDACLPLADVYYVQGLCDLESKVPGRAVHCFKKARLLYRAIDESTGLCEASIQLALTYLIMDDWKKCYQELKETLAYAEKNNLKKYVAMAHLYCGQYYLNQGMPEKSTPDLLMALEIFHQLKDVTNTQFVSNLAAVSGGQIHLSKYINLILKCEYSEEKESIRRLNDMVAWKDSRKPFWKIDEDDSLVTVDESKPSFAEDTISAEATMSGESFQLGETTFEEEFTSSNFIS